MKQDAKSDKRKNICTDQNDKLIRTQKQRLNLRIQNLSKIFKHH